MSVITSETIEEEKLNYTFFHWGPLLFRTKIKPEDVKALRKLCDKSNEVWSDNLAGIIKGEYKIDSPSYTKIIKPYLKAYAVAYKNWYGIKLKAVELQLLGLTS